MAGTFQSRSRIIKRLAILSQTARFPKWSSGNRVTHAAFPVPHDKFHARLRGSCEPYIENSRGKSLLLTAWIQRKTETHNFTKWKYQFVSQPALKLITIRTGLVLCFQNPNDNNGRMRTLFFLLLSAFWCYAHKVIISTTTCMNRPQYHVPAVANNKAESYNE